MNYNTPADKNTIDQTIIAIQQKGMSTSLVETEPEALELIKTLIPRGASVMNGSSTTLQQIGYMDYLASGTHGWKDLHALIMAENDASKRAELRNNSTSSDYYLGSVHALTKNGEFIVASNTGSQLPHVAFTSHNLVLVVGTQKIVPSLDAAITRLEKYVLPLENERSTKAYGVGSAINKLLIVKGENPTLKRKIHIILVNKPLGF